MNVRPIAPDEIQLVAGWLTEEENYRWLDFGAGRQAVDAVTLKVMTQRDLHALRVYTPDDDDRPVGLVGLSDINRAFRTGTLWCVLGDKDYGRQGLTVRALSRLLTTAFDELALEAVNAWTLENNPGGQRILDLLNFRFIGRQRRCHYIDGRPLDRLWYDLLAEEHRELGEP